MKNEDWHYPQWINKHGKRSTKTEKKKADKKYEGKKMQSMVKKDKKHYNKKSKNWWITSKIKRRVNQ